MAQPGGMRPRPLRELDRNGPGPVAARHGCHQAWNREMPAIPAAPAARQRGAFSVVTPPSASTGMRTACGGFAQAIQSERRAVCGFRRREEHRPEDREIRAFAFRAAHVIHRVARYADQETGRHDLPPNSRRDRIRRQMHALRAARQRDILARIHQDGRAMRIRQSQRARAPGPPVRARSDPSRGSGCVPRPPPARARSIRAAPRIRPAAGGR